MKGEHMKVPLMVSMELLFIQVHVLPDRNMRAQLRCMLVYNVGSQLSGKPSMILTGHKETEGSAGTATYFFVSDDGVKAVYMADIPDGSQPQIEFCFPASECDSLVHVSRAYWLDLETDSKTDRP